MQKSPLEFLTSGTANDSLKAKLKKKNEKQIILEVITQKYTTTLYIHKSLNMIIEFAQKKKKNNNSHSWQKEEVSLSSYYHNFVLKKISFDTCFSLQ